MIKSRKNAFVDPNEALPYNTSVVATIRKTSVETIYAKLYQHPMVVDKKGTVEAGNQNIRLVIGLSRTNTQ